MPPTALAPSPDDMKARKVELVLQQLDSLPTLPAIALRLLALTGDSESKIHDIVGLVSADVSLTGKILSLVSSAAVGGASAARSGGVTNLQQAVVLLGFDALRNLILSVKVFEVFQEPADDEGAASPDSGIKGRPFKRDEFWKHSLAVATLAELLAPRCKPRLSPHDAFVCGLLHDIGKVAFDTAMPKSFARVVEAATLTRGDLADVERRIIGLDHALAGKRLAEAWNLPQLLTETIWLHGAPPPSPQAPATGPGSWKTPGLVNPAMVLLVGLCDLLVRRQHIGFSGNFLFPFEPEAFLAHLGLTPADVTAATTRLNEAVEIRARAIGLNPIESRELYLQSIANANVELGRANQQLALQNRKLAVRSTCFELLTAFYSRIVPAASPSQLLTDIGHVAHAFLDSSRLVLFSQDPSVHETFSAENPAQPNPAAFNGVGEVLLFDSTVAMHDSFLMSMPRHAGDQRVGRPNQNFTRPALPQLEWLLDRVHTFLGSRNCWFMPLLCGAQPVGGVLWLARETEENPHTGAPAMPNSMTNVPDLPLVAQAWGMTLRTAQIREQQAVLTESLAAANRELGALQQQLVRAKSLASVGEMAAGAAHEMNNPLAIMCGRAQLLAARLTEPALKQDATLIATQGERLSQIITDMMEFARPQAPRPAPLNLDALIAEAVQSAAERAAVNPDAIQLDLPAAAVPAVNADPRQIRSALAELLLNALQATRAVETENRRAAPVQLQVRFDPLDQQLIFRVTDEGVGMTPDVMKHAFAPFFSAKSAGRNRGMGLAKALRWVENHNGTIRLDSQPDRGTTAVLLLPLQS